MGVAVEYLDAFITESRVKGTRHNLTFGLGGLKIIGELMRPENHRLRRRSYVPRYLIVRDQLEEI
jgi:hypothetical protein